MSSPRKRGNTELLFDEVVRGAKDAGAKVTEIILRNLHIEPCKEIYGCKKDGRCVIKDDFNELYDRLESCDRMLIATPVFFYAPPAQLKCLIDRCQSFFVRKYILRRPVLPPAAPKREMFLVAVGGTKGEKVFDATFLTLKYFLDALDMELANSLLYKGIDEKGDILKHPSAIQEAYEMGLSLGKDRPA